MTQSYKMPERHLKCSELVSAAGGDPWETGRLYSGVYVQEVY